MTIKTHLNHIKHYCCSGLLVATTTFTCQAVANSNFITFDDIHQPNRIPVSGSFSNQPNVIKNAGFEKNDNSWITNCGLPTYDSSQKTEGQRSMKVSSATFTGSGNCPSRNAGQASIILSQAGLKLDPSQTHYTVSFDIFFNKIDRVTDQHIAVFFASNNAPNNIVGSPVMSRTISHGWNPVSFIVDREALEKQLPNARLDWSNVAMAIKIDNIDTQKHLMYIDNIRLSAGNADAYDLSRLPNDLRNSQERVVIDGVVANNGYYGSMTVGGKAVKFNKHLQAPLYSYPSALDGHIVIGKKIVTNYQGQVPPGTTPFATFGVDIMKVNDQGRFSNDSPAWTFKGYAGLLDTATRNTRRFGQGYSYSNGSAASSKHNRTVASYCVSEYYDAARRKTDTIFCGGLLTDASFRPIQSQGQQVVIKRTKFSISPLGVITGGGTSGSYFDSSYTLDFFDLQGKKTGNLLLDGEFNSQKWAKNKNYLAVLTNDGAGIYQKADNSKGTIPMLTVYEQQGQKIFAKSRYRLPIGTYKIAGWVMNDKYVLFSHSLAGANNTSTDSMWWLDVVTGRRGKITTELSVSGYDVMPLAKQSGTIFFDSFE